MHRALAQIFHLLLILLLLATPVCRAQASCDDPEREKALSEDTTISPITGSVDVQIPADVLYSFFLESGNWPLWNPAFHWVFTFEINGECEKISWTFNSVNSSNNQLLPNVGVIVDLQADTNVTWTNSVTALGKTLYFGRHEYFFQELSPRSTRFGSWEKAFGVLISTFTDFFVDSSLQGVQCLEGVYQQTGLLNATVVSAACSSQRGS